MNNRSQARFLCQSGALFLGLVLLLSSCSKITLPRLEFDEAKKDPSVPLRVKLELDSSVQQAAFSYNDACGDPQAFQVGNQLSQMLIDDSKKVFQEVVDQEGQQLGNFVDAILQYTVLEKRYDLNIPRLESDAEYPAKASLRVRALLKDVRTGEELYAETFEGHGGWNVSTDDGGTDCDPIGIGIPIDGALEEVSAKLVALLRESGRLQIAAQQLMAKRQQASGGLAQPTYPNVGPSTPLPGANPISPIPTSPRAVQPASTPSVQFRMKLVDANRNLVLEGGEAVKLLVEIQNVSDSTIPSAYLEIRGTPVLVEAFKRVVSIPVPLGSLKAGEKRTSEIRARLPRVKKKVSGELIVGIILSEGLPPGSHSILTEITPSRAPKHKTK